MTMQWLVGPQAKHCISLCNRWNKASGSFCNISLVFYTTNSCGNQQAKLWQSLYNVTECALCGSFRCNLQSYPTNVNKLWSRNWRERERWGMRAEALELWAVHMLFSGLCRVTRAHTRVWVWVCVCGSERFVYQKKMTSLSLCCAKHLWNLASLSVSLLPRSQRWPVALWGFEMSPLHTQAFHWKLSFAFRTPDYNILGESYTWRLEALFSLWLQ